MTVDTTDVVNVVTTDEQTLVSQREVPWLKLGRLVDNPLTAVEAAAQGGINFTVTPLPAGYRAGDGTWRTIGNRHVVVRDDTGDPLGVVASGYQVLQYGEAFDFMDAVSPHYVAAGSLKGGRQAFMVVRAPETLKVLKDRDVHELFLVLRTSHDCTRAVEVSAMPLRHRCMNQLTLRSFAAGVPYRWTVRHTSTLRAKLTEASESLARLGAYARRFEENVQRLAAVKLTEAGARTLLEDVLPDRPRRAEKIEQIAATWHTSDAVGREFDYTGWGLLNAVSEHMEWQRVGGSPESRFIGALQGQTHTALNRLAGRLLSRT